MILAKTRCTKIPDRCTKCAYRMWFGSDLTCTLLGFKTLKSDKEGKYIRPKNCPLFDTDSNN